MLHGNNAQIAKGFVYLAATVPGSTEYLEWNKRMYCSLQRDIHNLQTSGYKCSIMGDFNRHVGDDEEGIDGNIESICI